MIIASAASASNTPSWGKKQAAPGDRTTALHRSVVLRRRIRSRSRGSDGCDIDSSRPAFIGPSSPGLQDASNRGCTWWSTASGP